MNFMRFVGLPLFLLATVAFALAAQVWAMAAIAGMFLAYYLTVLRVHYADEASRDKPWLQQLGEGWTNPSGLALLFVGTVLAVGASEYGLSIGVIVGAAVWLAVASVWAINRLRDRRSSRD